MTATRTSWNIPDPDNKLAATRLQVKAYAAAHGLELAEALRQLIGMIDVAAITFRKPDGPPPDGATDGG